MANGSVDDKCSADESRGVVAKARRRP